MFNVGISQYSEHKRGHLDMVCFVVNVELNHESILGGIPGSWTPQSESEKYSHGNVKIFIGICT